MRRDLGLTHSSQESQSSTKDAKEICTNSKGHQGSRTLVQIISNICSWHSVLTSPKVIIPKHSKCRCWSSKTSADSSQSERMWLLCILKTPRPSLRQSWLVKNEPYHLKCTWLRNPLRPPLSTSPWAVCVICWDLNLLLLFNKSTAIKIGLQLCFRLPNDIGAWNIFWLFFPLTCLVFTLSHSPTPPARRNQTDSTDVSPPHHPNINSLPPSRSVHLWGCWHKD